MAKILSDFSWLPSDGDAGQLETTLELIREFDQAIAQLIPKLPDYALFASLPGAGIVLTPRLLTALCEDRDRFRSAAEV